MKILVVIFLFTCSSNAISQCHFSDSISQNKKERKISKKCFYEDSENLHVKSKVKYRKWGRYRSKEKFLELNQDGKVISRWRDRAKTGDYGEKYKGIRWVFNENGKHKIKRQKLRGVRLH
ncbi:MAG: hypothetical protein ACI857_000435 [Arenicella sp.]|jgi:hypothetical protein